MVILSYGGGVNSQALALEAYRRGLHIDLILFANTGSEMPWTLEQNARMSDWLVAHNMPPITEVRWIREDNTFVPLHEWCIDNKTLPSKAFGLAGCTSKWKQLPLEQYVRRNFGHLDILIERWVGYDADESRRVANLRDKPLFLGKEGESPQLMWRAPLYEWRLTRTDCIGLVRAMGLPFPQKSSCFMCPMMRPAEVIRMSDEYPGLLELALHMEQSAEGFTSPKIEQRRLGMNMPNGMSWNEFIYRLGNDPELANRVQRELDGETEDEEYGNEDMPCGCTD